MKVRIVLGALVIAALATACGASVTVEQEASLCLAWPDGGAPGGGAPSSNLACENIPGVGVLGNPELPVDYVCIEPDELGCPSPLAAHARFASCVEERTGPACQKNPDGTFTQGRCAGRITVTACGPDPAAVGACCYYATIVAFEFYT